MENDKIIIYQTEDGQTQIDVRLENDMATKRLITSKELLRKLTNGEETAVPVPAFFLSAKHHYLPRYSPTMPTGSLAFTYPHPADLSSPVSYSFFPALL